MTGPGIVLCEQANYWLAGLRRMLAGRSVASGGALRPQIQQARTPRDALATAGPDFDGVLIFELTVGGARAVLDTIAALDRTRPAAKNVVVAKPELRAWRRAAQLAGGVYFATSYRQLGPLVEMIEKREAGKTPHDYLHDVRERFLHAVAWDSD